MLAIATMILGMASCKKENKNASSLRFTASMEGFAKTVLNGETLTWNGTENITVSNTVDNTVYMATYTATPQTSNARVATFAYYSGELGESEGTTYRAFYPANITTDGITVKLPEVQESQSGELSGYPMYTESTTERLAFKNLCSVLKLTLKKNNKSVSKIQIITDKLMNGTFTVDYNNGDPILTPAGNDDHTAIITMQLANPIPISTEHNFYIYLPKNDYHYIQIKVYDANGLLFYKTSQSTSSSGFTFERSKYYPLSFIDDDIEFTQGNVNGKFHVSPTKVVTFAKGNLLPDGSNYKFASEQYISNESTNSHPNLYTWGTSGSSTSYNERGNLNITNGGGSNQGWYTLSGEEWKYVCNSSHNNGRGNYITYHTRSHIKVIPQGGNANNAIGGLILFPDVFYWPLDASKEPSRFENDPLTDWNNKILTYKDWKVLEDAGCVFLPTTGYIAASGSGSSNHEGSSYDYDLSNEGFYWSSEYAGGNKARYLIIRPQSCLFSGSQVTWVMTKMAIRLVKNVTLQQQEEE